MHNTYLLHDGVDVSRVEGLLQFLTLRDFSLRDVHEDVGDLEDIVDVGLYTAAPFLDFVLVAGDLEALAAFLEANDGNVREPAARLLGVQRSGQNNHTVDALDLIRRLVDGHFVVVVVEAGSEEDVRDGEH